MLKFPGLPRLDRREFLILRFSCLFIGSLVTMLAVSRSGFLFRLTYSHKFLQSAAKMEREVKHVAFLKVHKTGSSTVQNVFLRFGHSRGLTFILGRKRRNECGGSSHCISFRNSISSTNIIPPPKNKTFEILCSHVVYNKSQFMKYLPSDTHYIGIVREPVHRLESAIAWFGLLKGVLFSEFAEHPSEYNYAMLNNRMAFEFGFRKEWFPSVNYNHAKKSEEKEIAEYVNQVINDFTLILINERLDELLVLMKRLLHWTTRDIVYHSKLRRNHSSFTEQDSEKLRRYLYLDYLLYESVQQNIDNKISKAGPGFYDEVDEFKDVNKRVIHFCSNGPSNSNLTLPGTKLTDKLTIDTDFCANLLRGESLYFELVRMGQYTVKRTKSFRMRGRSKGSVYHRPRKAQ